MALELEIHGDCAPWFTRVRILWSARAQMPWYEPPTSAFEIGSLPCAVLLQEMLDQPT